MTVEALARLGVAAPRTWIASVERELAERVEAAWKLPPPTVARSRSSDVGPLSGHAGTGPSLAETPERRLEVTSTLLASEGDHMKEMFAILRSLARMEAATEVHRSSRLHSGGGGRRNWLSPAVMARSPPVGSETAAVLLHAAGIAGLSLLARDRGALPAARGGQYQGFAGGTVVPSFSSVASRYRDGDAVDEVGAGVRSTPRNRRPVPRVRDSALSAAKRMAKAPFRPSLPAPTMRNVEEALQSSFHEDQFVFMDRSGSDSARS